MSECNVCKNVESSTLQCFSRLNNCPNYRAFPRIYVQFNELVFSGINSVETADLSGDYKITTSPYPFKHGSYYSGAFKETELKMEEQELSLDISLPFINLTRLQVLDYANYIQYNFSKAGILWAFDTGGVLIWAFAIPKHPPYTDYEVKRGKIIHYTMDFILPEGVWHKANTNYVFLEPYSLCDFKDTFGTGASHTCNAKAQCENKTCDICCDVDENMRYCNTCWNPYNNCEHPYKIIYNCALGKQLSGVEDWGYQFMGDSNILTGSFISNAVINSPVTVTLFGKYLNPKITINDHTIKIEGLYNGRLQVLPDGRVMYYEDENPKEHYFTDCFGKQVKYENITYGNYKLNLTAKRGNNIFQVVSDDKHTAINLAYVSIDEYVL